MIIIVDTEYKNYFAAHCIEIPLPDKGEMQLSIQLDQYCTNWRVYDASEELPE